MTVGVRDEYPNMDALLPRMAIAVASYLLLLVTTPSKRQQRV
jgi:hypothetical protein